MEDPTPQTITPADTKDTINTSETVMAEEAPETAEVNESPQTSAEAEAGFAMPETAVTADQIVDHDFWAGITLPEVKPKRKNIRGRVFTLIACLAFMAAGFGIACVTARGRGCLASLVTGNKNMTFSLPVAEKPDGDPILTDSTGRYTSEGIAQVCGPSVVSLDIFTDKSRVVPAGQGSGIILSADGYIVSNAHVVDKATGGIKVVLSNGSEYAAEVVGSDANYDIAVIKIPAIDLTPAQFGDSDQMALGEEVVVIGCPAGYRNSVTKGVVSGLDRMIRSENSLTLVSCIQIDAAVNPGNSGGALFNMWGQVVGITSSKLASVNYEGIGFAISSNQAKEIIEGLIEGSSAKPRVRIGITFTPVSQGTADMSGTKAGIMVMGIDETCDVARTELQVGDIITEIDGEPTEGNDNIPGTIQKKSPGEELTCHVYRPATDTEDEKEFDITFKVMEDKGTMVEDPE